MPGPSPLLGWPPPATLASPINLSGVGHAVSKIVDDQAVLYTEVEGYREHFGDNDLQATRVFDVPWTSRGNFCAFMLGYSNTILVSNFEGNLVPQLQRVIPHQHPERPYLYASRVELQAINGIYLNAPAVFALDSTGLTPVVVTPAIQAQFAKAGVFVPLGSPLALFMVTYRDESTLRDGLARYAVTYTPRDYEIRTDLEIQNTWAGRELARHVSREYSFAAQTQPFPVGSLYFVKTFVGDPQNPFGGSLLPEVRSLFRTLGITNITYTWHDVPDPPISAISTCLGAMNSVAFDGLSGFPQFPVRTLLCHAPRIKRKRNVAGRVCWDITYFFSYRPIRWDFYPASDGNFYQAVFGNKDGTLSTRPPQNEADYNILFQVPPPASYQ